MTLSEQNNISIAEIAIYTPALAIGVFLCLRHGFGRNAGWLFLVLFSLIRIVGGALELAATVNGLQVGLLIGSSVMAGVGLSPLILIQLGLLGRALQSIRRTSTTIVIDARQLRLVQLLVVIGLILGAVGGSNSGTSFAKTGVYVVAPESKAGLALTIVGYALLVLATVVIAFHVSHAEPGEKRLVLAVGLSLPFILVRLIYPCVSTLGGNKDFSLLQGNINIQLGMSIIMEMIVVAIVEAIGLTVKTLPKSSHHNERQRAPGAVELKHYQREGVEQRV